MGRMCRAITSPHTLREGKLVSQKISNKCAWQAVPQMNMCHFAKTWFRPCEASVKTDRRPEWRAKWREEVEEDNGVSPVE